MVSWDNKDIRWPAQLPDAAPRRIVSPFRNHYYFNVVTYGYTMPYWTWERWEKEIDWMALHGIDMPLALVATEGIAVRVWKQLGLTEKEIEEFYTGPAHLPWQRMGNIVNHDGPLPASWHKEQIALQHRILHRMKSLGMTPICPAFSGFVPRGILRLYPEAKLHRLGWGGWPQKNHAHFLSPEEPLFLKIGRLYMQEWQKEFGKNTYFLADSFNEMELPKTRRRRSPQQYAQLPRGTNLPLHFLHQPGCGMGHAGMDVRIPAQYLERRYSEGFAQQGSGR